RLSVGQSGQLRSMLPRLAVTGTATRALPSWPGPRVVRVARCCSAGAGARPRRCSAGVADRRDVEGQGDLLADQHAAGLERGVPGDAPVLAVDDDLAGDADALVAERVGRRALELEVDGDGLRGALDGQVAGDPEGLVVDRGDLGGHEGDLAVV